MSITEQEKEARRRAVDYARHSIEMEGGCTDDDMREVEEAYVRGEATLDDIQAVARRFAPSPAQAGKPTEREEAG